MKKLTVYTTAMNAFEFEVPEYVAEGVVKAFSNGANFEVNDISKRQSTVFANAHVVAIEVEG